MRDSIINNYPQLYPTFASRIASILAHGAASFGFSPNAESHWITPETAATASPLASSSIYSTTFMASSGPNSPPLQSIPEFLADESDKARRRLLGHNFGLGAAVVNFNRYPELVVVVARAVCFVAADHCYDDFLVLDLAAGRDSAARCIESIVL